MDRERLPELVDIGIELRTARQPHLLRDLASGLFVDPLLRLLGHQDHRVGSMR